MKRKERAAELLDRLPKIYPGAHCELDFTNALELLVATILSAQRTDKRVNLTTPALFARYRTAADYAAISQEEMEEVVSSTGFYRNKAKNIRAMGEASVTHHGGEVPETLEELAALPGVGARRRMSCLGMRFQKRGSCRGHACRAVVAAIGAHEIQ